LQIKIWCAAAALALGLAAPAQAQDASEVIERLTLLFGDAEPFVTAYEVITEAVATGDGEALADYFPYGETLMVNGEAVELESEFDLYQRYDELITAAIAEVVASQSFETLFVNADGVMFGDGAMWLSSICLDDACAETEVKIIALNEP
jgi:hypothetical protein